MNASIRDTTIPAECPTIPITPEELAEVERISQTNIVNPFVAAFIPVRTNNLEHFSKDLFSPMVSLALKIEDTAAKFFAVIGAVILDILLLPVRLLTTPIRLLTANKKEDHSLYKFLKAKNIADNILKADTIKIKHVCEANSQNCHTYLMNDTVSAPRMQYGMTLETSFVDQPATFNPIREIAPPEKLRDNTVDAPQSLSQAQKAELRSFPSISLDEQNLVTKEMKVIIKCSSDGHSKVSETVIKAEKELSQEVIEAAIDRCRMRALNDVKSFEQQETPAEITLTVLLVQEEGQNKTFSYYTKGSSYNRESDGASLTDSATRARGINPNGFSMFPFGTQNPTVHLDENNSFLAI